MTIKTGRADRARARLLAAAIGVFGEKGPKGAAVREIARVAGRNVAAIAYYFGSKEKLYPAVLEGIVRDPDRKIGLVDLMTAEEQQKVLVEWSTITAEVSLDCLRCTAAEDQEISHCLITDIPGWFL